MQSNECPKCRSAAVRHEMVVYLLAVTCAVQATLIVILVLS